MYNESPVCPRAPVARERRRICWWLVIATTTSRVYIISLSSLYGSLLISRIRIQKEDEQPLKAAGIGIATIASLFHALFPPELAALLDKISTL